MRLNKRKSFNTVSGQQIFCGYSIVGYPYERLKVWIKNLRNDLNTNTCWNVKVNSIIPLCYRTLLHKFIHTYKALQKKRDNNAPLSAVAQEDIPLFHDKRMDNLPV